jgi:hypothetical protein
MVKRISAIVRRVLLIRLIMLIVSIVMYHDMTRLETAINIRRKCCAVTMIRVSRVITSSNLVLYCTFG